MKNLFTLLLISAISQFLNAQIPSYIPKDSRVGWWPFNGNANDESGNGNNGSISGASLTTDRTGKTNSAYNFDGIDDAIKIKESINGDFTLSVWYYTNNNSISGTPNGSRNMFYQGINEFNLQREYVGTGFKISAGVKLSNNTYYSNSKNNNTSLKLGEWSHVVMTYQKTRGIHLYINGKLVDSSGQTPNLGFWTSGSNTSSIGSYHNGYHWWDGKLDDIGIWNRALNSNEVKALYNPCLIISNQLNDIKANVGSSVKFPITINDTSANISWQTSQVDLPFYPIPYSGMYSPTKNQLQIKNITNSNHNQKIRVIAKNNKCSDTSNTASIFVNENCSCCQNQICDETTNNSKIIGNWNFDGKLIDKSQSNDTAKIISKSGGTVSYESRYSVSDSNLVFKGSPNWSSYNSYVSIPLKSNIKSALQKEFSLSLWLNYNDTGYSSDILNTGNDNNNALVLRKNPNNSFGLTTGGSFKPINSRNKWNLIGLTWDSVSKDVKLYWNGKLVSTSKLNNFTTLTNEIRLGGHPGGSNGSYYPYIGKMDKFIVFNSKLDSSYFQCMYNNPLSMPNKFYDTVRTVIYDTIAVQDTLIINAKLTGTTPLQTNLIKVYPNPAKDHLVIDFGNYSSMAGYEINIFDVAGKSVYNSTINKAIETIDLNTWTGKGIYFIKIFDKLNHQIENRKIVIQ